MQNYFEEKSFQKFETDINLYYCGKRIHNFSHHYGPYSGSKYLIYYIKEGKAILTLEGRETEIKGEGFFVNFPDSHTTYRCKEGVPWSIKWIMADGQMIERYLSLIGITKESPYLALSNGQKIETVFDEMYAYFDKDVLSAKMYCVSLFHKLFSLLAETQDYKGAVHPCVRTAWEIIERQYSNPEFNISVLAEELSLNYNYFSVLFKRETGETPKKTLGDYRLSNACKMLKFTNRPIKEIAVRCGFSDQLYFSRAFRNKYGISPSEYRASEEMLT